MRVATRGLLVLAVVSSTASCQLDSAGLGAVDAHHSGVDTRGPNLTPMGIAGESGTAGAGSNGVADASTIGSGAGGDSASGAGGDSVSGAGTSGGVAGSSAATGGVGGSAQTGEGGHPATGGAGGPTAEATDANPVSLVGCADEAREGFKDMGKYPRIAACAGAWQIAGLVSPESLAPQCGRQAGNSSSNLVGAGCSVADLCAEGWHVCESAREVQLAAATCTDAFGTAGGPLFFATRQRGAGTGAAVTCDLTVQTGTNNIYGCGNFGSAADNVCAPFTRMLRDADCQDNPPWMCVEGRIDYNVNELADVTKPGSSRGGVLCCR
jgi:hypothetical protein